MSRTFHICGTFGECSRFMPKAAGEPRKVRVCIVPLKILEKGAVNSQSPNGSLVKIFWQCNFGKGCFNKACSYAFAWQKKGGLEGHEAE